MRFGTMRDDQRKAMFAKMHGIRFSDSDIKVEMPKVEIKIDETPTIPPKTDVVDAEVTKINDLLKNRNVPNIEVPVIDTVSSEPEIGIPVHETAGGAETKISFMTDYDKDEDIFTPHPVVAGKEKAFGRPMMFKTEWKSDDIPSERIDIPSTVLPASTVSGFGRDVSLPEPPVPPTSAQMLDAKISDLNTQIRILQEKLRPQVTAGGDVLTTPPNILKSVRENINLLKQERDELVMGKYISPEQRERLMKAGVLEKELKAEEIEKAWERHELMQKPLGAARVGFKEGLEEAEKKFGSEVGTGIVGAVKIPGRVLEGIGHVGKRGIERGVDIMENVAAPAALGFAQTAGVGVTGAIAEISDINELPKREFWTPPGFQKVWTGREYETQRVPRYVMEPWGFNPAMGVGMPPGVQPTVAELPTPMQARRIWGPTGVVQKERGYGGADTEFDVRQLGDAGLYKSLVDVPRVQEPAIPKWIIPPAEIIYGKKAVQPKLGVPYIKMGAAYAGQPIAEQRQVAKPVEVIDLAIPEKYKPYKQVQAKAVPKGIFAGYNVTKEGILKPKSYISRSLGRTMSDKSKLDDMRSSLGAEAPEVKRLEAKVQSEADYVSRHVSPGSYGELMLRESGLVQGGS